MKKKTTVVIMVLCAMALIATTAMSTIAYLTASQGVVNTFVVGNIGLTLDELDIDSDTNESDNVRYDDDGDPVTSDIIRDRANQYKLVPDTPLTKDPTLHVTADSEPCYLFVKVENGLAGIEAQDGNTIADQMAANDWVALDAAAYPGVYYLTTTNDEGETVAKTNNAGTDPVVFETVMIAADADVSTYGDAEINVTAYAIQAAGFEDSTMAEIWSNVPQN